MVDLSLKFFFCASFLYIGLGKLCILVENYGVRILLRRGGRFVSLQHHTNYTSDKLCVCAFVRARVCVYHVVCVCVNVCITWCITLQADETDEVVQSPVCRSTILPSAGEDSKQTPVSVQPIR